MRICTGGITRVLWAAYLDQVNHPLFRDSGYIKFVVTDGLNEIHVLTLSQMPINAYGQCAAGSVSGEFLYFPVISVFSRFLEGEWDTLQKFRGNRFGLRRRKLMTAILLGYHNVAAEVQTMSISSPSRSFMTASRTIARNGVLG